MEPGESRSFERNPYAPPQVDGDYLAAPAEVIDAWRDGTRLVMHSKYDLPPICAKTLEPADSKYILYIGFFHLQPIVIPVTRQWKRKRWLWFFIYLGLAIAAIPAITIGILYAVPLPAIRTTVCMAGIGMAAFFFLLANDMFSPFTWAGREGPYLLLNGFGKQYLERLPTWPGKKKLV